MTISSHCIALEFGLVHYTTDAAMGRAKKRNVFLLSPYVAIEEKDSSFMRKNVDDSEIELV
jgi:hypothetical protein